MMSEEDVIEKLRGRIHKMADVVQTQGNTLLEHSIEHKHMKDQIAHLADDKASRHELRGLSDTFMAATKSQTDQINMRFDFLERSQKQIMGWLTWAVGLVLATVLLAGLNLVLKKQDGPEPQSIETPAHVR